MSGVCSTYGKRDRCIQTQSSVRKPEGRRPLQTKVDLKIILNLVLKSQDRLCGLVVRVLGYRSGNQGSNPGTTKKKVVGLERGPLSLVSTTEELLDIKVAAPV
jgi:hypothetical protein